MKSNDFVIKEDIVTDAHVMHADHEVQMARADCYNAAKYAIELHKILKQMSETGNLEGWVSEKITLANDYLRTVHEYLSYEEQGEEEAMPGFDPEVAGDVIDRMMESAGGVGASSFAISMGGPAGNGFGKSVFYKNKSKTKKIKETATAVTGQPAPAAGQPPKPGAPAPAAGAAPAPASGSTASGTPPAGAPGAAAATQPGQSALTGAQTKPAGGTPAAAPAAKAQTPAGGAPGTPPAPAPGQPAQPGAAPAQPGAAPAKPGAPAGTATPPNPAQVKKDTETLTGVLNNAAHPMNAELQALIKKAAAIPH